MNPFSCVTQGRNYEQANCIIDETEGARVRTMAIADNDVVIDETDPDAFAQDLLDAEKACKATIIRNISGSLDDPALITRPGFGDALEEEIGQDMTLPFVDRDYVPNIPYYNGVKNNIESKKVYYMTETIAWPIAVGKASIAHKKNITNNPTEKVTGTITLKWSEDEVGTGIKINRSLLAKPQQLFDPSAMVFVNVTGSTATISSDGGSISETASTAFEVKLDTAVQLSSVEVIKGVLPTGLVATINPAAPDEVLISGSSAVVGQKKVVLKVSNACGIYTLIDVVVTIVAA